jgi:hypothetical protein
MCNTSDLIKINKLNNISYAYSGQSNLDHMQLELECHPGTVYLLFIGLRPSQINQDYLFFSRPLGQ